MSPSDLPRFGVRLHGGLAPHRCIELGLAAEASGFHSLWFAENPFHRGVLPAASALAAQTTRIKLGIGIVNPYNRHPTLIAMEFGALDELAGGRAVLGIGSGIGAQVERMGFRYRPLAALRDTTDIVRGLLRGDEVTYRGHAFAADKVKLGFRPPRPDMPIYMASMGDRSLELCGRLADGLIVSNLCPPGYTERAIGIVQNSAADAGRAPLDIAQYAPCVARPDRDAARQIAKSVIAEMLTTFWPVGGAWPPVRETIVRLSGIAKPEILAALDRLRRGESASAVLDDRFIKAFAIAGTAADCLAQAGQYRRRGVDELVLTFAGAQPAEDMAYFAACLHDRAKPLACG
ncbi:MAG TPA: LLM class flavin-dependent oxidoreductase [Stellaceae bacterium]|nr:LLM class flavin-dependent oxidoreductase [Stellaceae bacterium]